MLIYKGILSASEKRQVECYLGAKWGVLTVCQSEIGFKLSGQTWKLFSVDRDNTITTIADSTGTNNWTVNNGAVNMNDVKCNRTSDGTAACIVVGASGKYWAFTANSSGFINNWYGTFSDSVGKDRVSCAEGNKNLFVCLAVSSSSTNFAYFNLDKINGISNITVDTATVGGLGGAINSGTAQANAVTTQIKLAAAASATDNLYNGMTVTITGGTPAGIVGQSRTITGYVGSTKIATVSSAFSSAPTSTTTYKVDSYYYGVDCGRRNAGSGTYNVVCALGRSNGYFTTAAFSSAAALVASTNKTAYYGSALNTGTATGFTGNAVSCVQERYGADPATTPLCHIIFSDSSTSDYSLTVLAKNSTTAIGTCTCGARAATSSTCGSNTIAPSCFVNKATLSTAAAADGVSRLECFDPAMYGSGYCIIPNDGASKTIGVYSFTSADTSPATTAGLNGTALTSATASPSAAMISCTQPYSKYINRCIAAGSSSANYSAWNLTQTTLTNTTSSTAWSDSNATSALSIAK